MTTTNSIPFGLTCAASLALASLAFGQCESSTRSAAMESVCEESCTGAETHLATSDITPEPKSIVATAVSDPRFSTLVTALEAAGLVAALQGDGPFTVFAPTNEAFGKVDKKVLADLFEPENKAQLGSVLKFHVVSGKLLAANVIERNSVTTLNGDAAIRKDDHGVWIAGARITATDIACSNGVIHVIDSVMMPPAQPNIVELAAKGGQFGTLVAAVKAAGLVDALSGPGPLTVFAPTDAAFEKLGKKKIASLLDPKNRDQLIAILKYHVVAGSVDAKTAVGAGQAETLQGGKISARIVDGRLTINASQVVGSDLQASNGIVHVIDTVLLPR